jgi:hypothetical protein
MWFLDKSNGYPKKKKNKVTMFGVLHSNRKGLFTMPNQDVSKVNFNKVNMEYGVFNVSIANH